MKTRQAVIVMAILMVIATSPSGYVSAQDQATTGAAATSTPPTPPKLSETLELKRQNAVLRSSLMTARIESLRMQIEQESAAIKSALDAVRSEVEKSHDGWTLNANGELSAKAPAEKK